MIDCPCKPGKACGRVRHPARFIEIAARPYAASERLEMSTKWAPSAQLTNAIARVEAQCKGGEMADWNTDSHLACIRYLVEECGSREKRKTKVKGKDGKEQELEVEFLVVDPAVLKMAFGVEAAFLGYASNAKKMLQEFGSVPKKAEKFSAYE